MAPATFSTHRESTWSRSCGHMPLDTEKTSVSDTAAAVSAAAIPSWIWSSPPAPAHPMNFAKARNSNAKSGRRCARRPGRDRHQDLRGPHPGFVAVNHGHAAVGKVVHQGEEPRFRLARRIAGYRPIPRRSRGRLQFLQQPARCRRRKTKRIWSMPGFGSRVPSVPHQVRLSRRDLRNRFQFMC